MSIVIPLQQIPNQSFSITLNRNAYNISLQALNNVMACTIVRNDIPILSGIRAVAGTPLIPYLYLEGGNFIFIVENNEIPYYTSFGINQTLLYFTTEELREIRV